MHSSLHEDGNYSELQWDLTALPAFQVWDP